ncbi:phosphoribosylamine--glycine ligase [Roseomonas sp. NAR14]|uniref:Phosphoribosylamine--glycine ligase n=1 Tax=Roseomonas acroporae TaxID=2937791 RepID=A0A9X1Y878_9PROT|nr:phosphoribosylamine--glycine ligase [Roseomonas acroporae]MCK8783902.1 phosphoribosylamine--glycine ligase [Roseomonas acroporae]
MSRALLAALALLGLAACARSSLPPIENPTPDQIACREEAARDPRVADYSHRYSQSPWAETAIRDDQRATELRAYRNCLAARGVRLPGGVEMERRPSGLQIF